MGINDYTIEQLESELKSRKKIEIHDPAPARLVDPDWTEVIEFCERNIEFLSEHGFTKEVTPSYVYEAAMMALFGKDVFDWINRNTK